MKVTRLKTWHRVSAANATEASPAGTIKFHYAVDGTPEELKAYEEARGTYLRKVDDPKEGDEAHKGKPMWMTSQQVPDGTEISLNKDGYAQVVEKLEDVEAAANIQKLEKRLNKGNKMAEIEAKAMMAAKYGVSLA